MLNNKNKYLIPFAVCLLTFSACDSNESLSVDDEGKTPIELTTGIVGENPTGDRAQTRNLVTTDNPYGHAAQAFAAGTSLYMVIKSENGTTDPLYTRTIGYAQAVASTPANSTVVGFASGYNRFWEDSQSPARDSKLSVYAVCVPGYYLAGSVYTDITPNGTADGTTWSVGGSPSYSNTWATNLDDATIAWPLRGASVGSQTADFLVNQDLCFSNNVSYHSPDDERLAFNTTTNKFTSGRMVFYHALTKITFKIKRGDGFGTGTDVFKFTNAPSENIVLKGFNTSGTLDMSTGEFLNTSTTPIGTADISLLANTRDATADAEYDYVLTGMMLPGSALTGSETEKVYFTIDNNKYHITKAQLATAIGSQTLHNGTTPALADGSTMRPGVHYVFTMTVSKKGIDKLSAAVVDWEEVNATATPSNARITVSLISGGDKLSGATAAFDLYRSANVNTSSTIDDNWAGYDWNTGYSKATLTQKETAGEYEASDGSGPWYWPNNKTFYHFRTVFPTSSTITTDEVYGDYITLTGGRYIADNDEGNYKDVCWGAPFNAIESGQKLTYSTTSGFDNTGLGDPATHQISKAIGPTTGTIVMKMIHMMSDVTITLTTLVSGDADYSARVNLENAKMELSNIYSGGKVLLGNGLVQTTGSTATVNNQINATPTYCAPSWRYGFVPQSLENVVLTITTADNNQYIVNMKDMVATVSNTLIDNPYSETSESGKYTINYWYPNFKYTYTFKLKKSGIETLSATIADWGTVSADPQTVQIK